MHEKFRKRLEVLEETAARANAPPRLISVVFVNPDKTPVIPTVARTSDCDFECFRREGEDEDRFMARAHAECRAADPRPVQILIFSDKEISQ
jgi:hypothetical protein